MLLYDLCIRHILFPPQSDYTHRSHCYRANFYHFPRDKRPYLTLPDSVCPRLFINCNLYRAKNAKLVAVGRERRRKVGASDNTAHTRALYG